MSDRLNPLPKRLALRLLRCYPRPWQRRYLAEMQALLEEIPVGWRQTMNVAAIAVREWLSPRALGWPARTAAARVLTARASMLFAAAVLLQGIVYLLARRLSPAWSDEPYMFLATVLLVVAFARVFSVGPFQPQLVRSRGWLRRRRGWRRPLTTTEAWICAALLLPFILGKHVSDASTSTRTIWSQLVNFWLLYGFLYGVHGKSLHTWRLHRVDRSRQKRWPVLFTDGG